MSFKEDSMPVSQSKPEDVPDPEPQRAYTNPVMIAAFIIILLAGIYYVSEKVIGVEPIVGKPPHTQQSAN